MEKRYIFMIATAALGLMGAWSLLQRARRSGEALRVAREDAEAEIIRRYRPAIDVALSRSGHY